MARAIRALAARKRSPAASAAVMASSASAAARARSASEEMLATAQIASTLVFGLASPGRRARPPAVSAPRPGCRGCSSMTGWPCRAGAPSRVGHGRAPRPTQPAGSPGRPPGGELHLLRTLLERDEALAHRLGNGRKVLGVPLLGDRRLAAFHRAFQRELADRLQHAEARLAARPDLLAQQALVHERCQVFQDVGAEIARPSADRLGGLQFEPAGEDGEAAKSACSSAVSRSWLQAIASRIVCCRAWQGGRARPRSAAASAAPTATAARPAAAP